MAEEDEHPEQGESAKNKASQFSIPDKFLNAKAYLLVLATIVALSITYYFVYALPGIKRDALEWEKDKYNQEVSKRKLQESTQALEQSRKQALYNLCIDDAADSYWEYIKLNGRPIANKKGVYSAPMYVWNSAEKKKKAALDECYRQYRQ